MTSPFITFVTFITFITFASRILRALKHAVLIDGLKPAQLNIKH